MSDLYFNEESDYSAQNTSVNENFRSTSLHLFQFAPEQENRKRRVLMRALIKKIQKASFAAWNYNTNRNNIKENSFINVHWIQGDFEKEL